MKQIIVLLLLFVTTGVFGQDWGVGVRVGDPIGLTVKKYVKNNSIELNIGSANLFYDKGLYYKGLHYFYVSHGGKPTAHYSINKASAPIGFQLRFLSGKSLSKELLWYHGFGGQFRIHRSSYNFQYQWPNDTAWHYTTGEKVIDIDMGLDAVTGLEYSPAKIPISLFIDMTLFMEAEDDPFIFWLQGGVGLRYRIGSASNSSL